MSQILKVLDWVTRGKDASASLVLERFIRERLARYGTVSKFSLNSRDRVVRLDLLLHGETEPVNLVIEEYELMADATGVSFVVRRVSASRTWIDALLKDFVVKRPFPIPEKYGRLAKFVL